MSRLTVKMQLGQAFAALAALGDMQRKLVLLIEQVRSSSDSIATASAQIATVNADLSSRTEHQAQGLTQVIAAFRLTPAPTA